MDSWKHNTCGHKTGAADFAQPLIVEQVFIIFKNTIKSVLVPTQHNIHNSHLS